MAFKTAYPSHEFQLFHHQVDHLPEVKELADDGDWAVRIPTTVVIELEVIQFFDSVSLR